MTEPEDDDIYDVMPANEKTVSDIGKLKSMFEQRPMGVYTQGKPPPKKAIGSLGTPENRPVVAAKPNVKSGRLLNAKEIQDKQKEITSNQNNSVPSLPAKGNRISIVNGSIKQTNTQPVLPKKGAPPAVAKKNKPVTPVRKVAPVELPAKDTNHNHVSKDVETDARIESPQSSPCEKKPSVKFDNNVRYVGESLSAPNGDKYCMIACQPAPGPPPPKPRLPAKIDIDDLAQQYADDDDMYDDVLTDDPNSRVSTIPVFTEEEEKELARQEKADDFEQETYDDVRVDANADRKNRSLSTMSTGSDIYETFDELTDGADVKL